MSQSDPRFSLPHPPEKSPGVVLIPLGDFAMLDASRALPAWKMGDLERALLQGFVVKRWSQRFYEAIYYVPRLEHVAFVRRLLPEEAPIYTLSELHATGKTIASTPSFEVIHAAKKIFGGIITSIETNHEEEK